SQYKKLKNYLKWLKQKEKKENKLCKNNNFKLKLLQKRKPESSKEKSGNTKWIRWKEKKNLKQKENFRNKLCYLLDLMKIKILTKMVCQMYLKYIKQE